MRSMLERLHEGEDSSGALVYLNQPVRQSQLAAAIAMALGAAPADPENAKPVLERRLSIDARILVAEDNIINQRLLVLMLEKAGRRVDVAANGVEAVNALKLLPYDLVLMDCQMPELDGFAATRAIREHEVSVANGAFIPASNSTFALAHSRAVPIPVIALTANAMSGDREKCFDSGMDAYIAKPVRAEELLDRIEGFFGVHHSAV